MKGWAFDPLFVFIFLGWVPTIFLLAMTIASGQIQTNLANVLTNSTAISRGQAVGNILYSYDYIIPLLLIGSLLATLWYALFLKAQPFTFALGFGYLILSTFVSFYLSNAFHTIVFITPLFQQAAAHYSDLIFLINYMPAIVALITVVYFLIAVSKYRSGTLFQQG